ncbi:DUF6925 family protein [Chelatococcus reniformis]|uniref:Uncharacterized protein n=1 Tax=Chelatococcus reniformis TaxID=1494448 RepID=A0A916XM90_9HYPH|nr:hypothetical protein [Chelatococcus reniformis]GGC81970.1 hypothetical protein GCM10010994_44890 [Chelatococcus reniformis]
MTQAVPFDQVRTWLGNAETQWSLGTFGAIGEFMRDPEEPVTRSDGPQAAGAVTARGGVRLTAGGDLRLIAYETPNRDGASWSQAVALCLPDGACAMCRNTALAELGPDEEPLRDEDRGAVLFDLGLGTVQVDMCVRTADQHLIEILRGGVGRPVFEPGNPVMGAIVAAGPNRVFLSRLGRLEVFQPIPPPGGVSPEGPHTHLLPQLLRAGRTHAATTPIPAGWVPFAHAFPPSPLKDGMGQPRPFQGAAHVAFQAILAAHGLPELVDVKRRLTAAVGAGEPPDGFEVPDSKFARAAVRVALRQLVHEGVTPAVLAPWTAALDPRAAEEDEQEQPAHG